MFLDHHIQSMAKRSKTDMSMAGQQFQDGESRQNKRKPAIRDLVRHMSRTKPGK